MLQSRLTNFALFLHKAVDKGLLLFGATICALLIANSSYNDLYQEFIVKSIGVYYGNYAVHAPLQSWVNDFLMSIFFLLVGIEIKQELCIGHLSTTAQRILPFCAAFGGVLAPVVIYFAFNYQDECAVRGWAVPAATDIAFALGVLAFFGPRIPTPLKVFLTALAIIDDLIAVLIIAIFYTSSLSVPDILYMGTCVFILLLLNRYKIRSLPLYLFIGAVMWHFCHKSGIHATIAGVVLGLLIPLEDGAGKSLLKTLERLLALLVAYVILPIFAFVNAGIHLTGLSVSDITHHITIGVAVGLFFGKQLGVFTTVLLLVKTTSVKLPENTTFFQYYSIAVLCGIGFTMSLFIGILAFEHSPDFLGHAKLGIMLGSAAALAFGAVLISFIQRSMRGKAVSTAIKLARAERRELKGGSGKRLLLGRGADLLRERSPWNKINIYL